MVMSPEQQEVWALLERGMTRRQIADHLGLTYGQVKKRIDRAKKWADTDPAILSAMQAVGTEMTPHGVWAKVDGYSVYLRPPQIQDSLLDRVREAMDGITPAKPVAPAANLLNNLCTVYPIADRHNGLRAWGRETGEDYDHKIAGKRLVEWVGKCVDASPASELAVVLDVGDGEHMDDATNATPTSKHALDVDTRVFLTIETSVESLATAIDKLSTEVSMVRNTRVSTSKACFDVGVAFVASSMCSPSPTSRTTANSEAGEASTHFPTHSTSRLPAIL